MRIFLTLMWAFLLSGCVCAQLANPEPPSAAKPGEVSPAPADRGPTVAAGKMNVADILAAAHQKLEHGKAEQAFARAMEGDPHDMESVQMRGLALYRLGRPAAAIPFLERVREWTPNANADANYVLGLCYLNSQRLENARVAFANQFGVPPGSGPAYLLLGKTLMQANLPEAAAESAKKALELTPKIPLAYFLLG